MGRQCHRRALRALPDRLTTIPVGWILTTRPGPAPIEVRNAIDRLMRSGAEKIHLGPLDETAISTAVLKAIASAVLPLNRSIPTGRPSGSVSSPYSICIRPRLPSREYPNAASSHCVPSTQDEDRSYIVVPPWRRCRRASFFSIFSFCASSQSIASYTSSVLAPDTPRSGASVVSSPFHQRTADNFDYGRTARDKISA
jgi:hypothetical protein